MGSKKNRQRREAKLEALRRLSSGLTKLEPKIRDTFMCPVCLALLPIVQLDQISEAHIVPKAGGGNRSTYLCRRCNSKCGQQQDKWFGEYVRLSAYSKPDVFGTRFQPKRFKVDGVSVQGMVEREQGGAIGVHLHAHRNDPTTYRLVSDKLRSNPASLRFEFSFPILGQERMIAVGFLTAGYLAWFHALGYSWALQGHLGAVRRQIQCPEEEIASFDVPEFAGDRGGGWLGIISSGEGVWLGMGLCDRVVMFPPVDRPQAAFPKGDAIEAKVHFLYKPPPLESDPIVLLYGDRCLVAPDAVLEMQASAAFVYYSPEGAPPSLMRSVSDEDWDALGREPGAVMRRIDMKHWRRG